MALWDRVQEDVPAATLRELTNFRDADATTIDDTVGARWGARVEETLARETGQSYSDSDDAIVQAGIAGWLYYAFLWTQGPGELAEGYREEWSRLLRLLRQTTGGRQDRPAVTTTSQLTPTSQAPGATVRPDFDPSRFSAFRLRPPGR